MCEQFPLPPNTPGDDDDARAMRISNELACLRDSWGERVATAAARTSS